MRGYSVEPCPLTLIIATKSATSSDQLPCVVLTLQQVVVKSDFNLTNEKLYTRLRYGCGLNRLGMC